MNLLNTFAHGLVSVLGAFARIVLSVLDGAEDGLRVLLRDVGLSSDLQTAIFIFVVVMFLIGVTRLLRGRIRSSAALFLILVLAHTLERIAHGPFS